VFTATVLVNELLPVVHPRMATTDTAANQYALIEPPGFLMRNYGPTTFVTLVAHIGTAGSSARLSVFSAVLLRLSLAGSALGFRLWARHRPKRPC
jgi:hypothetical protein